ncbi:putative beta-adaptin [Neoconidiobolus thromboides FSU 785]|nr:putative beta-adaptin [Neoconidiobolus thromboides FSU 785]
MSDAKYFQRGKIQELRNELNSDKKDPKHQKKKTVMKKIVANMTMGNDMSSLYTDVVACMQINVLEIKKMVYLYLINYSRAKPEQTKTAIAYFLRDVNDPDPLIRALAIRTMSYIQVKEVIDSLIDPLRKSLKDSDPYVRKTAATCVAKLYSYDRNLVDEEGFMSMLKDLLLDSNPTVVSNAVAALAEISERSPELTLQINLRIASKLIAALNECNEWGQAYILETLLYVVPQEPGDAEMLAERVAPRLQHANASVVLNAIKVIIYLMNYMGKEDDVLNFCKKLSPPLVTLLSSGPEVQYVALRNILLIIQKHPGILKEEIKVFFCKYNDPIYVKLAKLEIIFRLATSANVGQVLNELVEYASEVDVDFVRKSVRAIGRLAIKIPTSTQRCISALLELIQTKVNYVVQEGIVVIKDIFRKYPNKYEGIIGKLCENLDSLDEPEAKAAMIWIIGQYADRIDNSDEILEGFMDSFLEEQPEVQLSLLTAVVKLFIKRPTVGQELVPKILKWATEEVDNPDLRDRGYIYWRLLSADPSAAKAVVLSEKPDISTETENIEIALLDELLLHISSLASVYHKIPSTFIPGSKPRFLIDSKVLHCMIPSQSESTIEDNNNSNNNNK